MTSILERARAQVVRRSEFDPMSHIVEIEADQFYEMIHEIDNLSRLKEGQAKVNSDLRKENERLKNIDDVLSDFNFEKFKKQREDFAREGFEEACAARQR